MGVESEPGQERIPEFRVLTLSLWEWDSLTAFEQEDSKIKVMICGD